MPIPNAPANGDRYRDALVEHLRAMTQYKTPIESGQGWTERTDHVIEAVGGDKMKPRRQPQGPDPTGITVLNQCWELGSSIGSIVTCSVGHPSDGFVRIRRRSGPMAQNIIGQAPAAGPTIAAIHSVTVG